MPSSIDRAHVPAAELRREAGGIAVLYAENAGRETLSAGALEDATGDRLYYVPFAAGIELFPAQQFGLRPLPPDAALTPLEDWIFARDFARRELETHFGVIALDGLGLAEYALSCGTFYGHQGGVNGTASLALVNRSGTRALVGRAGVGLARCSSEGVRRKVRDALFGAEEEFEYTSTTTSPASPAATAGRTT